MASSTQFSIRSLMIVTVMVAVVSTILGPQIREMEPKAQLRLGVSFAQLTGLVAIFVAVRFLQRHRAERLAGPLIWRTDAGEKSTRWAILIPALALATAATLGMIRMLDSGESATSFEGLVLSFCILGAALLTAEFCLCWWWQTGPLITEVYEKGLVLRGVVFLPWSALLSYRPSPEGPAVLIVTEKTRWEIRPRNVHAARQDRDRLERILLENGVPLAVNHDASGNSAPGEDPR